MYIMIYLPSVTSLRTSEQFPLYIFNIISNKTNFTSTLSAGVSTDKTKKRQFVAFVAFFVAF